MNEALLNLKPKGVWEEFKAIMEVPRPSKHEEKMIAYLESWAINNGFEYKKDTCGNVMIKGEATSGYEDRQTIVLQSHIDMVCEKNNDKVHDFMNDPIEGIIKGDWLHANGTTLGADDGIGVATALAILKDKTLQHGPLECIFTVDEETGLTGAENLDPALMSGRILLNLDSEDEGEIFIGCAGGKDTVVKLPYQMQDASPTALPYRIDVKGLKGGHSGDDINKNLANANKLLNRILWDASRLFGLRLVDFQGGNLRNAIAREAYAIVYIPKTKKGAFEKFVKRMEADFKKEYQVTEPGLQAFATITEETSHKVFTRNSQKRLLDSIYSCPHGVIAMSQTIDNFVETSTNLASVKRQDDYVLITTSQRSSIESSKDDIANMVRACFENVGAHVEHGDGYPGWAPNPNSVIRKIAEECYMELFHRAPKVKAIHAGLECGLIGDKFEGMDMISIGPTLRGVHSPDERIEIPTVQMFWDFVAEILKNAPRQ